MSADLASHTEMAPRFAHPTANWLRELRVRVDGASPTLDVAARVLTQLGAQVVRGAAAVDGGAADVVLVDRIGAATALPSAAHASAEEYLDHVSRTNQAVWVTASAFGLSTARADEVASDLTLLASGGILGHSRIGAEWAPTVPPGNLALKITGYVMVVAALHAVHTFRAGQSPIHVDVSARDSVIATGLTLEMAHALSNCPDEGGSARYGAPSGFFQCVDGSIYVLVLEQHQWQAFRRALAPLLDSVETLADARRSADLVNQKLAAWAANRTVEECERLLQDAGVPASQVNSLSSLAARARAAGRPVDLDAPDAAPLPAQLFAPDGSIAGPAGTIPLERLRVLDAGHVLAVPLAAAWLGTMGAAVTKLEDPERLDIYRRRGPFADGEPGLNRSAYFNQLNFSKERLELKVGQAEARLDLDEYDVVIHNLTPRRAKAVGVDIRESAAAASPTLAIASSGFGGTGPWANYRAYGHNIHAFAGLVAATRDARGEMGDMGTPWADPLTSVGIAAWVLAWSLQPDDRSSVAIDISMAELTAAQISDLGALTVDEIYAPAPVGGHFFIRPVNGPLLAVSLRSEAEVAHFQSIVGAFPSDVGFAQQIDIPNLSADAQSRLRAAGIPVAPVVTARDIAHDDEIRGSGIFARVTSRALGEYEITGLPWRFVGESRIAATAAPEVDD